MGKRQENNNLDKVSDGDDEKVDLKDLDGAAQKKASVFPQDDHNDLPKEFAPKPLSEDSGLSELARERLRVINARRDEMRQRAVTFAEELAKRHDVKVLVVERDSEFYSDALSEKSIKNKVYYVSAESPEATAKATDWLIKREARRDKFLEEKAQHRKRELLVIANEKRSEHSMQTAQSLNPIVKDIIKKHQETNNGKKPSLRAIAGILTKENVPAPGGSSSWFAETVKRVLNRNESSTSK